MGRNLTTIELIHEVEIKNISQANISYDKEVGDCTGGIYVNVWCLGFTSTLLQLLNPSKIKRFLVMHKASIKFRSFYTDQINMQGKKGDVAKKDQKKEHDQDVDLMN